MAKSKENLTLLHSRWEKLQSAVGEVKQTVRRRPRVWLASGIAALVLVGTGVAVALFGLPDWKVLDTVAHAATGKPTLQELQATVQKEPKNADAWLELGHALWDTPKQQPAALKAYDKALTLDVSKASARLLDNLLSCFGEKCQASAAGLIVEHKLKDAADRLVELTTRKAYSVRIAAVNTLERLGLHSKVDYVAVHKLDLQSSDCDVKRYAVERLGKLGDRRGLSAIRAARQKEEKETAWYEFDCIGGRAEEAEAQILARK